MSRVEMNLSELPGWLDARAAGLAAPDYGPFLKTARLLMVADARDNFAGSYSPDGTPWLPLKRPRRNSRGGDLPLRDTGLLMASVTAGGAGHVDLMTPTSVAVGTNLKSKGGFPYPAAHQHGAPRAHVPARPFLGFGARLVDRLTRAAADFARKLLGGG